MTIVFASERPLPVLCVEDFHLRDAPGTRLIGGGTGDQADAAIRERAVHIHQEQLDFSGTGENLGRSEIGERAVSRAFKLARPGWLIQIALAMVRVAHADDAEKGAPVRSSPGRQLPPRIYWRHCARSTSEEFKG